MIFSNDVYYQNHIPAAKKNILLACLSISFLVLARVWNSIIFSTPLEKIYINYEKQLFCVYILVIFTFQNLLGKIYSGIKESQKALIIVEEEKFYNSNLLLFCFSVCVAGIFLSIFTFGYYVDLKNFSYSLLTIVGVIILATFSPQSLTEDFPRILKGSSVLVTILAVFCILRKIEIFQSLMFFWRKNLVFLLSNYYPQDILIVALIAILFKTMRTISNICHSSILEEEPLELYYICLILHMVSEVSFLILYFFSIEKKTTWAISSILIFSGMFQNLSEVQDKGIRKYDQQIGI